MSVNRQRIIDSLRGQLESELLLGGRWLPMEPPDVRQGCAEQSAQTPTVEDQEERMTKTKKAKLLAELAEELKTCHQCPNLKTRLNVVPGEGNPDARIMYIGEAPGQTEDEQGRPFVGRAGQLLTNIIEAMGLKRQDVFIGNILKCRPPGNRDPLATEIAACIPYLHRQIEIIQPEIIVALGAYAARTLLDVQTPIGQLRGKIHEYLPGPMVGPIKLVATYHPAFLLRAYTPDNRRRVWQDMQRVLEELNLPIPKRS
ncbi:MAG: uracil-DNA glycosylase [Sedimentisphaerales bacterium]|nr:uracil-DNA glycosylase [Sedimentisphaerales bacterium]